MFHAFRYDTLCSSVAALALSLGAGVAAAQPGHLVNSAQPGYATSSGGVVHSGFGLCWHTRSWTPDKAVEPCDPVPQAQLPVPPVAAPAPPPALKPAPEIVAEPKLMQPATPAPQAAAPPLERVALETELLFDFNSAVLRPAGRAKLKEIALKLHGAKVSGIEAIGHADRIASEAYNQKLSTERALAVRAFLAELGFNAQRIDAKGHGETEPVTGKRCTGLGPERRENQKLVACLQPDRRVELEVRGTR